MDIRIRNSEEELKSFPLKQSIYLETDYPLEDTAINNNITLIREVEEYGLLNPSDFYNRNIGYVKEEFKAIDLAIEMYQEGDKYITKCTPKEPLHTYSRYILFLDKDLSEEHISIIKDVSKGPSKLKLIRSKGEISDISRYSIKVISKPFISNDSNIVKLRLYVDDVPDQSFTINAKSSRNTISFKGVVIEVEDTAYAEGEIFSLNVQGSKKKLDRNLVRVIKTASTSSIEPLVGIEASKEISNADVIEFYNKRLSNNKKSGIDFSNNDWQKSEYNVEYVDWDKFILHLNELNSNELDLDGMKVSEYPAFNKYDLRQLGLYDSEETFSFRTNILDDKTILFTLIRD